MSLNTLRTRNLASINNVNPLKNTKNNLNSNRKKRVLKVLTNTIQSTRTSNSKCIKLKVLHMKKFETKIKSKSSSKYTSYIENDEFNNFECITKEKDFLPSSMTCNIGILSNFFSHNYAESDWILEDNNVMINKIKNTFEHFGEPERDHSFPSLPTMDFLEPIFT